jgi:hypothetical protein
MLAHANNLVLGPEDCRSGISGRAGNNGGKGRQAVAFFPETVT